MSQSRGRPRKASAELLQEAAFELFQVQGYRGTSVEQIARTAGFSRATFFNFFSSKSELYWLDTDVLLDDLSAHLEDRLGIGESVPLREALLSHAESMSSANIPWALQNFRLLESADDLIAGGAGRVLRLNRLLESYLQRSAPESDLIERSATAAITTALLITALRGWINAGVSRGSFRSQLERILSSGA
ncbi:TetR/AcrR family transcriptional regulator [Leucobacter sp. W1478]|uniref:TetR/AcrR family transcriptional regulator n=1 Tax=Leucobacter sp. W1478 TaxID=3439065 RepID=UPI003F31C63F